MYQARQGLCLENVLWTKKVNFQWWGFCRSSICSSRRTLHWQFHHKHHMKTLRLFVNRTFHCFFSVCQRKIRSCVRAVVGASAFPLYRCTNANQTPFASSNCNDFITIYTYWKCINMMFDLGLSLRFSHQLSSYCFAKQLVVFGAFFTHYLNFWSFLHLE